MKQTFPGPDLRFHLHLLHHLWEPGLALHLALRTPGGQPCSPARCTSELETLALGPSQPLSPRFLTGNGISNTCLRSQFLKCQDWGARVAQG